MKIGHLLNLAFVSLLLAGSAFADPVTLNFSGTITDVEATNVTTGITDGTAYTATLSYDPADTSLGSCSSGPDQCSYFVNSDLNAFLQISIGSDTLDAFIGSDLFNGEVFVTADSYDELDAQAILEGDEYELPSDFGFDPDTSNISAGMSMLLNDPTGTAFADDSLPTSLDLSAFANGQLQLNLGGTTDGGLTTESLMLTGDVTTSATPEPSGAFLAGAGLLLLGCAYRLARN